MKKVVLFLVNRVVFTYVWVVLLLVACGVNNKKDTAQWNMLPVFGECDTVSIDTMDVVNPFIAYDDKTDMYYMTGDNGYVWKSNELHQWVGPYSVLCQDTASWLGAKPAVTSPEIHKFANKYYYMASFEAAGYRSCATLVADSITGPYKTIDSKNFLLDEKEVAAHPTFCSDEYSNGYMIYNHLGEQNGDGTVQIVLYNDNFGRRLGEAYVMFTASQIPWSFRSVERKSEFSPVLESPFMFYSGDEGLGVLFTAYAGDEKAIGVAYSETGTLNGPWIVESEPLLKGFNSVSLFSDYDGTLVMLAAKDTIVNGVKKSVPKLIKTDSQFEKLQIKGYYKF